MFYEKLLFLTNDICENENKNVKILTNKDI